MMAVAAVVAGLPASTAAAQAQSSPVAGRPTAAAASTAVAVSQPAASGRPRLGIALGGGSARGIAHIGVLQWFEEHRIPIDVVVGTSMGGLVGGAYAGGLTPEEIRRLMRETDWDAMFESDSPFQDKTFRRKQDRRLYPSALEFGLKHGFSMAAGLNSGQQVSFLLDQMTLPYWDLESFDQLPTPFRSVAVDLRTSTVVVLREGSFSQALRATMSIPAVFGPVEIGPWLLVDGGVLNNVPADVVRSLGASTVIAVRVGEDASSAKEALAPSILSLAGRTITTMETASERIGLAAADLVIAPDLKGFDSLSWRRSDELADRGYQGAEAMAARLLPYAVSEEEYASYLAERKRRTRTTLPIPTRIDVVGSTPADAALVRSELSRNIGRPVDTTALKEGILRVAGTDRFENVRYGLGRSNGETSLIITMKPKSYGPPFLLVSLELNNLEGRTASAAVNGRLTAYNWLVPRSESRTDFTVGSRYLAGEEFYVRLGPTPLFVAPHASVSEHTQSIYADEQLTAEYRVRQFGGGVDLGVALGRVAEVRLGTDIVHTHGSRQVGDPGLPDVHGTERRATLSLELNGQDAPVVPSRGVALTATLQYYYDTAAAVGGGQSSAAVDDLPGHFWQSEVTASAFHRVRGEDRLFTYLGAGTSFNSTPILNRFALGGPLRLSAYRVDELHGAHYLYGAAGYLIRAARLPDLIGGNFYVGAWLEAGSTFDARQNLSWVDCASGGVILESLLGPIFAGASISRDGHRRLYVSVGRLIR
jgi:NTE family protein